MRSFIYLTLLPTLFVTTFASDTPQDSPRGISQISDLESSSPQQNPQSQELIPGSAQGEKDRTLPGTASSGSSMSFQQGPPQRQTSTNHRSLNLPRYTQGKLEVRSKMQDPSRYGMVRHGYKCQKILYTQIEIIDTVTRACKMYYNNKKTAGVTRYPKTWKNPKDDKDFKIIFPLTSGKYFGFGTPRNHFVRISRDCDVAEVLYQVEEERQQASKYWCRLPNCFARGGKIFNKCTLLWEQSDNNQGYFTI